MVKRKYYNRIDYKKGDEVGKYGVKFVKELKSIKNQRIGVFECYCGKQFTTMFRSVRQGRCISCGCIRYKISRAVHGKHLLYKHPLYHRWTGMKDRCTNERNKMYKWYGGRGIKVCKEWSKAFMPFYEWAIKNGFKKELQLDRIDNNGNYEPSNCRFIPQSVNLKNTSHVVMFNGETQVQASVRLGGRENLIATRKKAGWSLEKAFTTPVIRR